MFLNMSFSCDALSLSKCSGVARFLFPLNTAVEKFDNAEGAYKHNLSIAIYFPLPAK
jgi:hypothetical protein